MNEPKRLIEDGTTFDRALLHAAREDRPPTDYERRVIAAAALVPAATAVAQPSLVARILRPRYLAVLAIGAGAAALATSSMDGAARSSSARQAPHVLPATAQSAAPASEAPANEGEPASARELAEPREAVAVTTPDALPTAPAPSASVAARTIAAPTPAATSTAKPSPEVAAAPVATTTPAPVSGAALEREVELLDSVKRSLRAGENGGAERALDAYDAEFPSGTLAPEAGFLRIRLLLAKGERARAVALGDALLARHPNSVHAKRIRAALAADAADPSAPQAPPR